MRGLAKFLHISFPFEILCENYRKPHRETSSVHGHVLKMGFVNDVFVHTSLVNMFVQIGEFGYAPLVFDKSSFRDAVSFTALITACAQLNSLDIRKRIHSWIEDNGVEMKLRLTNGLIDMHSKCGDLETAKNIFEGIKGKDVISWNVMVGGYAHCLAINI
ncbi:Pentatricopeptide repeat [Dillenia turbinata]|uniref:Pentatricopeptide repeat n=1 Tax=Dillenia turbinata TaxID=194707 RepID=A0AAN8ZKY2_9MAGN